MALGSKVGFLTIALHLLTRLGEANVDALFGGAAIDIGDKHGWVVGRALLDRLDTGVSLARTPLHVDGGTVHVHLAVADTIEPGPSEGVFAILDALRDGEVETGRVVFRKITIDVGWTSTLN